MMKIFLNGCFDYLLFRSLMNSKDDTISGLAAKSLKEVTYHVRHSSDWVIRLGDGTEESHTRMEAALENLWPYTGELFKPAPYEIAIGIDPATLHTSWLTQVEKVLTEATLTYPLHASIFMHTGGKQGVHSEQLGFLLAELQYMQRVFPGSNW